MSDLRLTVWGAAVIIPIAYSDVTSAVGKSPSCASLGNSFDAESVC